MLERAANSLARCVEVQSRFPAGSRAWAVAQLDVEAAARFMRGLLDDSEDTEEEEEEEDFEGEELAQ